MFRVSKMLFNGLMKSLNKNADFELLKAEVISILKKQAQNEKEDFKKSIIKSENLYSYLVKSTTGDFIIKSGYPIGTIREWKGKKYIKIAPKKWKRKFDKNDRGANISAGKLIKQVEKCESVEDLMKLVLANKQRFSDENGHPLPIVDKIRAAVDKKNESFDSESKTVKTPKTEKKNVEKLGKIPAKFELYRNVISNPETQSIESLKLAIEDMDKAKDNLELANLQEGGPTKKELNEGKFAEKHLKRLQDVLARQESEAEKHANRSEERPDFISNNKHSKDKQEKILKLNKEKIYNLTDFVKKQLNEDILPLLEKDYAGKSGVNAYANFHLEKLQYKTRLKIMQFLNERGYSTEDNGDLGTAISLNKKNKNEETQKNEIQENKKNEFSDLSDKDLQEKINQLKDRLSKTRFKASVEKELEKVESELKQRKTESTTENKTLSDVRKKYESSKSVQGNKKTVTLPNGEKIKCHYKLVEAEAPTATHDENTFQPTPALTKNGQTINDRDYSHDKDAQSSVINIASKYGGQALQDPPIVSKDGVVVSGNNRTMSSKLAAKNGTDKAYLTDLKEQIDEFGIDEDELKNFKHPRLILEMDNEHEGEYTTKEMAKFNDSGMKTQNTVEKAVKISKTLNSNNLSSISDSISEYETLGELYNDKKGVSNFISKLIDNGILTAQNKMEYVNSDNTLSESGKEFIETVLVGTVLNENNIRSMNSEGGKKLRKKLIRALMPLAQNKGEGNEYSITNELNTAVKVALEVSHKPDEYKSIADYRNSQDMFGDDANNIDDVTAKFADMLLNHGEKEFANKMKSLQAGLHESASGQMDMFLGDCESKEDVLKRVLDISNSVKKALKTIFGI